MRGTEKIGISSCFFYVESHCLRRVTTELLLKANVITLFTGTETTSVVVFDEVYWSCCYCSVRHWKTLWLTRHIGNWRFPEITGEDNLTVFSYSGRVKSPEWRWQWRRADLRHFEIFRHGPIIIYARLPPGGTCYPICMFPTSSECLIGISDAFSAFCLRVSVILPTCSLYPQQKRVYSALHPQAWTCIYRSMPESSYRVQSPGFPKIV